MNARPCCGSQAFMKNEKIPDSLEILTLFTATQLPIDLPKSRNKNDEIIKEKIRKRK